MRTVFISAGALICAGLASASCARTMEAPFSTDRARGHVSELAAGIGSRPVGTERNERARQYVVDQLRAAGFEVRVQSADARRPEIGLTVRVHNVIAIKEGARPAAIALVSHYDSSPFAPGGADDALGVAVGLEAGRVLLGQGLQHTLAVIVTDGEETGMMGAAALDADPIAQRLGAYINVEAVGSAGPPLLFEAGPGNGWIVDTWARFAPAPRGSSLGLEVYRRLPNDTDFSIIKRLNVPGLNFAAIGDGYAYHTARDTADRLSSRTLAETGRNVVAMVASLDRLDLSKRTLDERVYFDVLGRRAIAIGPRTAAWGSGLALVLGLVAWVKTCRASVQTVGAGRTVLTGLWAGVGSVTVFAAMVAAAWLLREAREVYHPWYARPERMLVFTAAMGVLAGWSIARLGRLLPARLRGARHPVLAWCFALPLWIVFAALASYATPGAAYLFTIPLLVASVLLIAARLTSGVAVRFVSAASLAANVALWAWLLVHLLRFAVAHFGRQPVITPVWVYAALMLLGAIVLAPPALAMLTGGPLRRPSLATAVLLAIVVAAGGWAYAAPAYTFERPLRRAVLYAQDSSGGGGHWQVASNEPGLDLLVQAARWTPLRGPLPLAVPVPRLPHPFVFHARVEPTWQVPGQATIRTNPVGDTVEFTISVKPSERGVTATFVMPPGLTPVRPNLPGRISRGAWTATFGALPPEGVAFHAFAPAAQRDHLGRIRVVLRTPRLPGGTGWQGLPDWLLQERIVWSSEARYIVEPLPEVAPAR